MVLDFCSRHWKCDSEEKAILEYLRPLLNRNIPLISGKYGLRNHFWPLESGFLMRKSEKKGPNYLGSLFPILRLTFLELLCNFRQFGLKKNDAYFFSIRRIFRTHVARMLRYSCMLPPNIPDHSQHTSQLIHILKRCVSFQKKTVQNLAAKPQFQRWLTLKKTCQTYTDDVDAYYLKDQAMKARWNQKSSWNWDTSSQAFTKMFRGH